MKLRKIRNLLLPVIAVSGIFYSVLYAGTSSAPAQRHATAPAQQPPTSDFAKSISGSGLIEANTRNIEVGSHLSGIVSELLITEGDVVEKGAPLFKLDDRSAKTDVATEESNLAVAHAQLAEAEVSLADQQDQLRRVEGLKAGYAVTVDKVSRLRFAQKSAITRVEVAKASIAAAQARLDSAKTTLAKLTVTAPISGRILKLNTRVGEFVQAGNSGTKSPVIMGNDTPLYVRTSIDENDLWRFNKEAAATGALRSNRNIKFPLKFVRLEPYVVPKTSLTGSTAERVDTRVLEVIYSIDAENAPAYIGQQIDVFIDASSAAKQ